MTARAAPPPRAVLRRETRFTRLMLTLLIVTALTLAALWLVGTFARRRPLFVPQPLRSVLAADYSPDPFADKVAGLNPELVGDILRDEAPTEAPDRIATVVSELQTPVPTVVNALTPAPTFTPRSAGTLPAVLATATGTPAATTTGAPSATATETLPGATTTTTASATLFVPNTPTRTLVPPTFTLPPPTFTLAPPTFTLAPPTFTAIPPTNTAVPPTLPPDPTSYVPPATDVPTTVPVPSPSPRPTVYPPP